MIFNDFNDFWLGLGLRLGLVARLGLGLGLGLAVELRLGLGLVLEQNPVTESMGTSVMACASLATAIFPASAQDSVTGFQDKMSLVKPSEFLPPTTWKTSPTMDPWGPFLGDGSGVTSLH